MAKKVKSLIHPALHVLMRTSPAAHFPSQPIMGSDYHLFLIVQPHSLSQKPAAGIEG